jgi:hypothetical protein
VVVRASTTSSCRLRGRNTWNAAIQSGLILSIFDYSTNESIIQLKENKFLHFNETWPF